MLLLSLICSSTIAVAQETDLFDLLDEDASGTTEGSTKVVYATFKGTQLINAATNETPGKGVLQYVIAHRFGSFGDEYLYNFFGLDNAQIRMQTDYGITDRLNIGAGRSSFQKLQTALLNINFCNNKEGLRTYRLAQRCMVPCTIGTQNTQTGLSTSHLIACHICTKQ